MLRAAKSGVNARGPTALESIVKKIILSMILFNLKSSKECRRDL